MADIDIGAISEALNNKTDRNMRNVDTSVSDSVIAWQAPTAENDYTWYRKYASGWVEQGGIISTNADAAFIQTLPVVMASNNYNVVVTRKTIEDSTGTINSRWCRVYNLTTTTFTTWGKYGNHTDIFWEVKGMSAQGE